MSNSEKRNIILEDSKVYELQNKNVQKKIKGTQRTNKKIKIGQKVENSIEIQQKQAKSFENALIQIPANLRKTMNNEDAQKFIKKENNKLYQKKKNKTSKTRKKKYVIKSEEQKKLEQEHLFKILKKYDFEINFSQGYSLSDLDVGTKIITTKYGESKILDLSISSTGKEWVTLEYENIPRKVLLKNLEIYILND